MVAVAVWMMMRRSVAILCGNGLGRGQDEPAGLHALGADQVVGQVTDVPGRTAEQNHFEAPFLIEMNVGRRDDSIEVVVLEIGQPAVRFGRRGGRRSA